MAASPLRAPVVLVHGIFGFNDLTFGGRKVAEYFRLLPDALRLAGCNVPRPPKLNPAGSIAQRAENLKGYLEDKNNSDVCDRPVHVIAHSMGGLDARYMIARLGLADRVLSLTTIGTPHHGSPIADMLMAVAEPVLDQLMRRLGVNVQGISDLTTRSCKRFNEEVGDCPKVRCFSVASQFEPKRRLRVPVGLLGVPHDIIRAKEGPNDGLVSVESATFGQAEENWTFLGTWDANHFRSVNWGADLAPTAAERADNSIVEKYQCLVDVLRSAEK